MAWCLLTFNLCQWPEYVKKETSYRLRKKHTSILFSFIRGTMHKNINPIREKMLCTRFSYKPIYIQGFWAVTQNMALITWCWMMKGLAWVTDKKQDLWFRWALDKFMDVQHKIHSWITHESLRPQSHWSRDRSANQRQPYEVCSPTGCQLIGGSF